MRTTSFIRSSILASATLSLAACMGGGSGSSDYVAMSPIRGVSVADIEDRTGITAGQAEDLANAVAIVNNVEGFADARLVIRESTEEQDAAIYIQVDQDGDGVYDSEDDWVSYEVNLNPDGDPVSATTGDPYVTTETTTMGGADVVVSEYVPDYQGRITVYVPADAASDMYGGMYVYSRDSDDYYTYATGAVATWGDNTTSDEFNAVMEEELTAQDGVAKYSGVAEAVVSGVDWDETGRYRDTDATGEIDFSNNTVTTSANMTGVDYTDSSLSVTTEMTYNSDGTINTGNATITGLSVGKMYGAATGEIYGPEADTLGVTFAGVGSGDATIVGGMLLNRTDDD